MLSLNLFRVSLSQLKNTMYPSAAAYLWKDSVVPNYDEIRSYSKMIECGTNNIEATVTREGVQSVATSEQPAPQKEGHNYKNETVA